MTERILYRVTELADLIGCSKTKAYELVASGEVPSVRVGNMLRVPADALRKMIAERTSGESRDER
jgi:excisionase family DNA binding protein